MTDLALVPRRIETRYDGYCLGVDFGSDATILAINGFTRLVWRKGSPFNLMPGCHGGGCMTYNVAQLQINRYKREAGGRVGFDTSREVFKGGRLSKARLLAAKDAIDAALGDGVAEQLNPKETLLCGPDSIGEYLEEYARRVEARRKKDEEWAREFMAKANAAEKTFDGCLL